jgi:hypothetical protein
LNIALALPISAHCGEKPLSQFPHVALLGDSVFDSRPYLVGRLHMATRVQRALPGCRATLGAVSGSRMADIPKQMSRLPRDVSHLVVSVGGNDLLDFGRQLRSEGILGTIGLLPRALRRFQADIGALCAEISMWRLKSAICTVYQPAVGDPVVQQIASRALDAINDAIETETKRAGIAVMDLRAICREPIDFADPIHPSEHGADKIAARLAEWVRTTSSHQAEQAVCV